MISRTVRALLLAALAGCKPQYAIDNIDAWEGWQPHTADEDTLRVAASLPDLATFHRDVALLCPPFGPERNFGDGCEIALLSDGIFVPTGRNGLMAAWRFDDDRVLTLDAGLDLALDDLDGTRTVIARGALDPRVADDGHRAVFSQLESGASIAELGESAFLTLYDFETQTLERITDDPRDSAPWLVPGSSDVLFTSARTGIASLWLASGDGAVRQLTNIGLQTMGPSFVPVPSRELVFLPESRIAVFSAHYGTHELWSVDLDSGTTENIGPGRLVALHPDGGVVAVHDDDPSVGRQVVRYSVSL